jgi:hypothetical protein
VLLRVVADGVFVAAEDVDGVAADAQARTGNFAAIDGVADGGVCGASAFSAHIAFGGETGQEIGTGGEGGCNGALRDGFHDRLQIFGAGMEEEVDVRVNQAREESGVAEIYDFCASWPHDFCTDFFYGVALDEDFAGGGDAAGFYVEEAGGVEDDGVRGCRGLRLRLRCLGVEWSGAEKCKSCG